MIHICPWADVERQCRSIGATHVISLLGVEGSPETPAGIRGRDHLTLAVDDIAAPIAGFMLPEARHIRALLDFARDWQASGPMVVHCYAGISRSTAAALAVLCLYNEGREYEATRLLRERAPHARPNRLIVRHADRLLQLNGRLIDAVETISPADIAYTGRRHVTLPARLG